jgi:hypothetical protein
VNVDNFLVQTRLTIFNSQVLLSAELEYPHLQCYQLAHKQSNSVITNSLGLVKTVRYKVINYNHDSL